MKPLSCLLVVACAFAAALAPIAARARESAETFFPRSGLIEVQVSPNGRWIAAIAHRGEKSIVVVQQVGTGRIASVLESDWVDNLGWESPDALIVVAGKDSGERQCVVARLRDAGSNIGIARRVINAPGWLVDPLPLVEDQLLWEFEYNGWTSLHRISIRELLAFRSLHRTSPRSIEIAEKLATVNGSTSTENWVIGRNGQPQAALRRDKEGFGLMMPAHGTGPLETVYRWTDSERARAVRPVGLSRDGTQVIVSAYNGGDTRGLWTFDRKKGEVGEKIFVDRDYDIEDVLEDPLTGDLIAAVYFRSGELRYHYFPEYRDRYLSKLPEEWRSKAIKILNGTADRQVFAFLDSNDENPGDFYIRDNMGKVHSVGRRGENVDRAALVSVESFRVKSRDGTEVEGFLTLPRNRSGPVPFVVMPHGGPQDVADNREFNPFAQYLANWGFAVVQVNYRGSSGYGLEFSELGKKEWARGIEDDIDAAVEHVMALPEVDEGRVCIEGGSYGGFSALASVIRHRDRYRCAISLNGVTDIPFLGISSDYSDSKAAMKSFERMIGDLETERDKLIEASPAYHVEKLNVPILVVYGTADRRVDPDHAHRMLLMLELHGKPHQFIELEGAEHSPNRDEWIIYARAVRRFLSEHLLAEKEYEPDPRSPYDR
ncbi:prolyl oligopeptidase family serine peptidase [Myxococcota bacterium]|nr:prolyl oligopeptidase family serine peptidase [Myxococcota bacterium]